MMLLNLEDYERLAAQILDPALYAYYAGGSEDEQTLQRNREIFTQIAIRPRVLRATNAVSLATTLLGTPIRMPIAIAPTASMGLAHEEGEKAVAQAAQAAGTLAIMSIHASMRLEEIRQAASGPLWQQCFLSPDRGWLREMLARIAAAGYGALVVTVDRPRLGKRERELRSGFRLDRTQAANFAGSLLAPRVASAAATWDDLAWLRAETSLPLVLKGILDPEDARLACAHDVTAIVVSNHGGRQFDGAITAIEALPAIVEAVAGRCEIYADGGIRRGSDVLKALALGARAVLVGRPILWGLAVNGRQGVGHVLEILRAELGLSMTFSGLATLSELHQAGLFASTGSALTQALPHTDVLSWEEQPRTRTLQWSEP